MTEPITECRNCHSKRVRKARGQGPKGRAWVCEDCLALQLENDDERSFIMPLGDKLSYWRRHGSPLQRPPHAE